MTSASGTNWALGVEARSRALVTEGHGAESLYQDSIMYRLGRSRVRAELARAHLLYGEWLRRRRRRGEAREQLRTAQDMLEAMGMEAFAERARRELRATGETARKRTAAASDEELTAQETQIARLAREGLSNPEIGARLKLEVVVVPVADVDRAKAFYTGLGWRQDADFVGGPDFRVVQVTPPGSDCSVIFGTGLSTAAPGSADGLHLVVTDIEAARADLVAHGADASEVFTTPAECSTTPGPRIARPDRTGAATPRSSRSATRTATAGCCRRSPPGCPGG